ncbi:MAG TPA: CPBP family intramembrane metalloprotease, partial [Clostridiales bacterium]|nr:CPBP family intramembrane metalloprotease [Clostridiales bacterium]
GVTFDDPELPMPKTLPEYLLLVIASVIVPAFVEEFAFRGVVLQSFRKYGDLFAVGMSSLLFACMHGNMTQMPFALILGVVMGILVVATDSIWTGIAIHLFNNTYAVCLTLISDNCSQMVAYTSTVLINFFGLALGLGACVFASRYYRGARAKKLYAPGGNTKKEQRKYHAQAWLYSLLSLPMLVAIALLIFNLYVSVHTGGTT